MERGKWTKKVAMLAWKRERKGGGNRLHWGNREGRGRICVHIYYVVHTVG